MDNQESKQGPDLLVWEKKLLACGYRFLAGVDEAGRGPLAGPVVAAACILPLDIVLIEGDIEPRRRNERIEGRQPVRRGDFPGLPGLNDSKKLTSRQRERLARLIEEQAVAWAVASADQREIDADNILQATFKAMRRAVTQLPVSPDALLIDGRDTLQPGPEPAFPLPHQIALVGGDGISASIAAASILAKVARDCLMAKMHRIYPSYGFDKHKGYGTKAHIEALARYGPCPIHRNSFAPVREAAERQRASGQFSQPMDRTL